METSGNSRTKIQRIKIEVDEPYEIFLGRGVIEKFPHIMEEYKNIFIKSASFIVITDKNVAKHHLKKVTRLLKKSGYRSLSYIGRSGEKFKTPKELFKILRWMAKKGATRDSVVLCLGGGVVGDIGGFAASIYMRGCTYIQIPTTLLAMVDSSVGGKTAVDLPEGKNLVGSFYNPLLIIQDINFLKTLPPREFTCGLAEIIKAGLIFNEKLFSRIYKKFDIELAECNKTAKKTKALDHELIKEKLMEDPDFLTGIIKYAVKVKAEVVREDEKEKGLRMLLNFGHTFAHGIEKIYKYKKFLHGEAVILGMQMAVELSSIIGMLEKKKSEKVLQFLKALPIPKPRKLRASRLYRAMLTDKKRKAGEQYFILLKDIGYGIYESGLPRQKVLKAIEKTLEYYS